MDTRGKAEDIILQAIVLLIGQEKFRPDDVLILANAYATLRSAPR